MQKTIEKAENNKKLKKPKHIRDMTHVVNKY